MKKRPDYAKKIQQELLKALDSHKQICKDNISNMQKFMEKNNNQIQNMNTIASNAHMQDLTKPLMFNSFDAYQRQVNQKNNYAKELMESLSLSESSFQPIFEKNDDEEIPTPLELTIKKALPKIKVNEVNDKLYYLDCVDEDGKISINLSELNRKSFMLLTRNPEGFASDLLRNVEECDDEELSSIFSIDFLSEIAKSNWWILPYVDFEKYMEMSKNNFTANHINQYMLMDNVLIPTIKELTNCWDIKEDAIKKYVGDAVNCYYSGDYVESALLLLVVINICLNIDLFDENIENIKIRLESKLNDNIDVFDVFRIKSYKSFLDWIVKPLYYENALDENPLGNFTSASAFVKQMIAIRMFMVLNTLITIFKIIGEDF